jgi:predicted nucleic acid-binding protein
MRTRCAASWTEQLGRTGTQVLSEYYVTVTRKLKPGLPQEQAWDDVEALMQWQPQPVDLATLQRARAIQIRHPLSWWDALVVTAAPARASAPRVHSATASCSGTEHFHLNRSSIACRSESAASGSP